MSAVSVFKIDHTIAPFYNVCPHIIIIARYTVYYVKDKVENYTWLGMKRKQKYSSQQDQLNQRP